MLKWIKKIGTNLTTMELVSTRTTEILKISEIFTTLLNLNGL